MIEENYSTGKDSSLQNGEEIRTEIDRAEIKGLLDLSVKMLHRV